MKRNTLLAQMIGLQLAGLMPRGASGVTKIADVVVPARFSRYVRQQTAEKSRLVQSGILAPDDFLSLQLSGGGLTFNAPSWKDLDNDAENIATDDESTDSTPNKIGSATEISVRLSRNNSWSAMALAAALAGDDPMAAIADKVSDYWARRLQAAFIATVEGVYRDNAKAPTGSEHVQNDLTIDISGASYIAGTTDFSAEAFIDAAGTLGDSANDVTMVGMHSVVFQRAQKNNLIDFIPDSTGQVQIPTFLGREVIEDDGLPNTAGVYDTWLFGAGSVRLGVTDDEMPTELDRKPAAGTGSGQDVLHSRVVWTLHPSGHAYAGTAASGGPSNANTANNLAHEDSWARVFPERKQIKLARLITRES